MLTGGELAQVYGPYGAFVLALGSIGWLVKKNEGLEKTRNEQVVSLVSTVKSQGEQMMELMQAELKTCHERNLSLDQKVSEMARDIVTLRVGQ